MDDHPTHGSEQGSEADHPEEACGVFGVLVASEDEQASFAVFDGLYALQHRGQESAGIAAVDDGRITVVKDLGLVASVFDEATLRALRGRLAIGHTRYATAGDRGWENAQPLLHDHAGAQIAVAHNGNLTDPPQTPAPNGRIPSDTERIAAAVAEALGSATTPAAVAEAVAHALAPLHGAFSLVMTDGQHLIAARDRHGFRPLCVGRFPDGGWVVASETPALDVVGASFEREVDPGEVLVIGDDAQASSSLPGPHFQHLCVFEFVYFARPDAKLLGREVHGTRRRMGEHLARVAPVEADMVMGVPDSGIPAAEGYALASGIPYGQGLVKNRYIGRTFINPGAAQRRQAIRRKLNALEDNVRGKRLVVVDDSIVRGATTRQLVALLRQAGAAEVHLRISSPPYRWPCYYGIDTPSRPELIASRLSVDEIAQELGADSLAYLPLAHLRDAVGVTHGCCDACLTGAYPETVSEAAAAGAGSR
ncbi:amidophosphoribosyltransferase [Acidimicrobium ferrooxidans DSM 10331]|uniref:Amidophosphoribosyltransferase n=1 Tax=Acidimicrobium ferrooxidans (strain DSM 10331 / JCM 15462 / NBRC 103882 / ICP) TaxID=525909 RepID=C7M1U9_ACIFD|nr:amidophosphoribosyltransferase [Acidimicrobium ferrooxidans]ACU54846.1 amidophosphoribosyltransferase [Acidimicrobium ferrooxidans DSM 10331]